MTRNNRGGGRNRFRLEKSRCENPEICRRVSELYRRMLALLDDLSALDPEARNKALAELQEKVGLRISEPVNRTENLACFCEYHGADVIRRWKEQRAQREQLNSLQSELFQEDARQGAQTDLRFESSLVKK